MAERHPPTPLTPAFRERASTELSVLNNRLTDCLKKDISRIYSECLFADLNLLFHSGCIRTHKSLLQTRAPRFYKEICINLCKKESTPVLDQVSKQLIESFIREVYNQNVLRHKEDAVVAQIKKVSCLKEILELDSPESDVFLTPKASPSEVPLSFSEGKCGFNKSEIKTASLENLHKTNALYYSLVHVEDDLAHNSLSNSELLEKELAEQDELSKSFRSIIIKECQTKNQNSSLPTSKCDKPSIRKSFTTDSFKSNQLRNINQKLKIQSFATVKQTEKLSKPNPLKKNGSRQLTKLNRMLGAMSGKRVSDIKESEDVSNIEIDQAGPDSCLEAGSSGYLTGGSPKDTIGSEGVDTTEIASSEDIPHDNERSVPSSSVSSDAGTWDSTFPTNDEQTYIETELNIKKDITASGVVSSNSFVVINEFNFNEESSKPDTSINQIEDREKRIPSSSFYDEGQVKDESEKHISNNFQSLGSKEATKLVEAEMNEYNSNLTDALVCQSDMIHSDNSLIDHSNNSLKNNFFIDASSLNDESEVYVTSQAILGSLSSLPHKTEPKCNDNDVKTLGSLVSQNTFNLNEKSNVDIISESKFDSQQSNGVVDEEMASVNPEKKNLIRRNTFELDPDDEKLALLRQEYEKNQESGFFDNSTPCPIQDYDQQNNPEMNVISQCLNMKQCPTTQDEDVHSPDSLNNDFPYDSFVDHNYKSIESDGQPDSFFEIQEKTKNNVLPDSALDNSYSTHVAFPEEPTPKDHLQTFSSPQILWESDRLSSITITSGHTFASDASKKSILNSPKSDTPVFPTEKSQIRKSSERFREFESTPIVSGGTIASDLPLISSSSSSPLLSKRNIDCAPIVSGNCEVLFLAPDIKKVKSKQSSMTTSWVVDMSYSEKSPESSAENAQEERKTCASGFGFFIPLDDPHPSLDSVSSYSSIERKGIISKKGRNKVDSNSCGFFIDLKDDSSSDMSCNNSDTGVTAPEKKFFSMFIDIGGLSKNEKTSPKSKPASPFLAKKKLKAQTLSGKFTSKLIEKQGLFSSGSSFEREHPEVSKGKLLFQESSNESKQPEMGDNGASEINSSTKKSFYMFIDADESPVIKRRTLPSGSRSTNRHSWGTDMKKSNYLEYSESVKEHRRASSASGNEVDLNEDDKAVYGPASVEESCLKSQENRKSKLMMASWHGPVRPSSELSRIIANGAKHEFKESHKDSRTKDNKSTDNSDCDKVEELSCSLKSDDAFDVSNATTGSVSKDDPNQTFVIDEVSKAVNVSSNDLELSTPSHEIVSDLSKDDTETDHIQEPKSTSSNVTNKSVGSEIENVTNEMTPKLTELSASQPTLASLPEPSIGFVKLSDMDKEPAPTWRPAAKKVPSHMSRSIPEASWLGNKIMTNSSSSRSLTRLFPHLYPHRTPESEDQDHSNLSSLQSSVDPSVLDYSTEGTECSSTSGPCSRLGEDLLRMFLDEISPDVTIEVGGRRIRAHKCILSSRCQYFAAILSGGWVESAGDVISLPFGFSYNTVHFALCHIYSGASKIPETINIVELATLADMLCLEGLKEVIMYTLKVKYCHFFHKPCSDCTIGVLECLPLAAAYGLDEIYRKSLKWISRFYTKVWPTKGFANLPKELQEKCYKQHIVHMTTENVLETIMDCDKLDSTIPNVRWAQPVFTLNTKLHDAAVKYLTQHFSSVLSSDSFMGIGKEDAWTVGRLENTLMSAAHSLSPDQSCQSYSKLKSFLSIIKSRHSSGLDWKVEFIELLEKLESQVEDSLVRQAGRAARTPSWAQMELSLRRNIQEMACLVFTPGPRHTSLIKRTEVRTSRLSDIHKVKDSSTESPFKKPQSPQTRQQFQQSIPVAKSKSSRLANVKSKYLEPKPVRKDPQEITPTTGSRTTVHRRMSGGKALLSSSDSSRTSSPAASRVPRTRPTTAETKCRSGLSKEAEKQTPVVSRRSLPSRLEPKSTPAKDSTNSYHKSVPRFQTTPKSDASKVSPVKSIKKEDGSMATSSKTPSPSLARTAPQGNVLPIKRTSTFRVTKSSPQAQMTRLVSSLSKPKDLKTNNPNSKLLNNNTNSHLNIKSKNAITKGKMLTVGARSGTFLKDEPTVLRKSQASNVND